jgi:nucleotide-binding universal stress UspA family protein
MRVLIATDGSPSGRTALELIGSLRWEPDTSVRVIEVLPHPPASLLGPRVTLDWLDERGRESLHEVAAPVRREGIAVQEIVLRGGRAADRIVASAREWEADLVATGSRGRGQITSMLLGSVAAGVTDLAPCPVLVARRPTCARVLLADDGSESAIEARRIIARWPIFRDLYVHVVSVAHEPQALRSGISPTMLDDVRRAEAGVAAEARSTHEQLARESAEELRRAGLVARTEVRSGDPAAEILDAALRADADLIVLGSRGRTGIVRAALGSVARNVLIHASCSVLIVRHRAFEA